MSVWLLWHLHHHGDELQQINMNWKGFLHNISQSLSSFTNDKIDVQSHMQGAIIMKMIILVMIMRVIPMSSWQAMPSSCEKTCVITIGFKQKSFKHIKRMGYKANPKSKFYKQEFSKITQFCWLGGAGLKWRVWVHLDQT
jgi:hypothetical protein